MGGGDGAYQTRYILGLWQIVLCEMPSSSRRSCVVCGRHDSEVGPISWRGKCGECGPLVASLANDQIHYHVGPVFEKWRRRMAASVGAVLEEDTRKA